MEFSTIAKSDIFFVITTLAVILITTIVAIALVYLLIILRAIKKITKIAETTTSLVADDISTFSNELKTKGMSLSSIFNFFKTLAEKRFINKNKKSK